MKKTTRTHDIRREQKKSLYFRIISQLISELIIDQPLLRDVFVSRVDLSPDGGMCYVFFASHTIPEAFDKALEVLKLYKPSLRTALAQKINSRYTPEIVFRYDTTKDKERHIHSLLDKIKEEVS